MLDTTFAGTGSVITGNGGAGGILNGVVVQADGKNVVVGYTHNGISNDFVIMRYNTNGSLDSSFGTGGIAIVAVTSAADNAARVALQSDGKIVVCGTANSDFAVVRLNTNGTLDTSFDTDGIVTTPVLTGADIGTDLAIQTDGKIVVAGYASNGVNNDFAVVRYNANGSLDTSFDTDGKVTTAVGTGRDEANAVALTSTGLIIAAGRAAITGSGDDFALVRYTTAGALDTTFDTDGKFTHIMGTGAANDIIYDVAVVRTAGRESHATRPPGRWTPAFSVAAEPMVTTWARRRHSPPRCKSSRTEESSRLATDGTGHSMTRSSRALTATVSST
jgi:uncharacterized delta-60 repeat protein